MIFEYAVDPSFFTTLEKAMFILESFGRDQGRLVSEFKRNHWVDLARDAINKSDNQTIYKHKLKEALKILSKDKGALYSRQEQDPKGDWFKLTKEANINWPYRAVLLENCNCEDGNYLERDICLSVNDKWQVPVSLTVDRDPQSMLGAITNLLANAREVVLVDRNFRLENSNGHSVNKYKNVLLKVVKFLADKPFGPKVFKLNYHIGDENYDANFVSYHFDKHLKKNFPGKFYISFYIWPKNELHDRLILTDIGGVDCGVGLDEFTGNGVKTVTFKRLSNEDYKREWNNFKNKKPAVTLPISLLQNDCP